MIEAEWTNKDSLDLQPTCNQLATTEYALNQKDRSVTPNDITRFPSADSNANQRVQHVGSVDLISRQAAIDAVRHSPIIEVQHCGADMRGKQDENR